MSWHIPSIAQLPVEVPGDDAGSATPQPEPLKLALRRQRTLAHLLGDALSLLHRRGQDEEPDHRPSNGVRMRDDEFNPFAALCAVGNQTSGMTRQDSSRWSMQLGVNEIHAPRIEAPKFGRQPKTGDCLCHCMNRTQATRLTPRTLGTCQLPLDEGDTVLETLGLTAMAEQVYRMMLAFPEEGITELATRLGAPVQAVRDSLAQLSELAIIQPSEQEENGFRVLDAETAMELLLARQHADLAAQQLRVEASRAAAAQLIAEYAGVRPRTSDDEHLIGPDIIRERLARLAQQARDEIMTFAPGGAHPAADLEASRGPNEDLLDRGVRSRTIYLDSVRNHKPTLDHVNWLSQRGAAVRTTVSLPLRLIIFDRCQAVVPTNMADARTGAVLLTGEGTVTALCALFEATWENATPWGDAATPADSRGLTVQQAEMLKLLADGMTDEAIAKRFGISPRTARRIAAELMELLDARSRFQAGVHSVQRGLLPLQP